MVDIARIPWSSSTVSMLKKTVSTHVLEFFVVSNRRKRGKEAQDRSSCRRCNGRQRSVAAAVRLGVEIEKLVWMWVIRSGWTEFHREEIMLPAEKI